MCPLRVLGFWLTSRLWVLLLSRGPVAGSPVGLWEVNTKHCPPVPGVSFRKAGELPGKASVLSLGHGVLALGYVKVGSAERVLPPPPNSRESLWQSHGLPGSFQVFNLGVDINSCDLLGQK